MVAGGMGVTVVDAHAAVAPDIIGAGAGEGDFRTAAFVGGDAAFCFSEGGAVVNFIIGCVFDPGLAEHQIAEGVLQVYGQGFARVGSVIVGVAAVFIGKQVEAAQLMKTVITPTTM